MVARLPMLIKERYKASKGLLNKFCVWLVWYPTIRYQQTYQYQQFFQMCLVCSGQMQYGEMPLVTLVIWVMIGCPSCFCLENCNILRDGERWHDIHCACCLTSRPLLIDNSLYLVSFCQLRQEYSYWLFNADTQN